MVVQGEHEAPIITNDKKNQHRAQRGLSQLKIKTKGESMSTWRYADRESINTLVGNR